MSSSIGDHLLISQDNGIAKTRVTYLEADDLKVNRGSVSSPVWKDVITTSAGDSTDPQNLRIYDINPTSDPNEKYSLVTIRWNFDNIEGSGASGTNTFTLQDTSFTNEEIDLNYYNPVGKLLYFPESDNSYEITGATYSSADSTYTLTLESNLTASDTSPIENPAKIIDKNIDSYRISIKNANTGQVYTQELDSSFIKKPQYSRKLELGETWNISIQALDIGHKGTIVNMTGGQYDPDHGSGGQEWVSYGTDFTNKLPFINNSNGDNDGSITLTADTQGFIVKVGGWNGPLGEAHEYEFIYSSEVDDLKSGDFDNIDSKGIERKILTSSKTHISAGQPTRFPVAVRPLQNKQPVDDPITGAVVSGGGGIAPNDTVLVSKDVDIKVVTAEVTGQDNVDEFKVIWRDIREAQIAPNPGFADGRYMRRLDGTGVPIDGDDFRVKWHRNDIREPEYYRHRIRIPNPGSLSTSEKIISGTSEKDRLIEERTLDADYRVTKLEFLAKSTANVSSSNPAIIRVYQKGFPDSATTMEIRGEKDTPWTQTADLPIKMDSNQNRVLVVDAFDPSSDPNNECDIVGKLTITGRPIVINN